MFNKDRTLLDGWAHRDPLLFGLWIVTSGLTALLLALGDVNDFPWYGMFTLFFIPAGAVFAGAAAAAGYYFGAKLFAQPSRVPAIRIVLVAIGTHLLIYWFTYGLMEIDGRRVPDLMTFSEFTDIVLNHPVSETLASTSKSLGSHILLSRKAVELNLRGKQGTAELDHFGAMFAALQIIAFALGQSAVLVFLSAEPYCHKCKMYLKQEVITRYTNLDRELESTYRGIVAHLKEKASAAAAKLLSGFGNDADEFDGHKFRIKLTIWKCPSCMREACKLATEQWNEEDRKWEPMLEYPMNRTFATRRPTLARRIGRG